MWGVDKEEIGDYIKTGVTKGIKQIDFIKNIMFQGIL